MTGQQYLQALVADLAGKLAAEMDAVRTLQGMLAEREAEIERLKKAAEPQEPA